VTNPGDSAATRTLARCGLAVLLTLATLLVRMHLPPLFGDRPLLILFMFPILISALLGGLAAGLVATAVSAGVSYYFFLTPGSQHQAVANPYDFAQWLALLANGVLASVLSHALQRSRQREVDRYGQLAAAQDRLRRSEMQLQATFDQAAVGIALLALDGHWRRVNPRLCQILGYTEQELLASTFAAITHPDDVAASADRAQRLLAGEFATYALEKRYLRKDGTPVWVTLTTALLRGPDGAPDSFISVIEDIDARKRAEDNLGRSRAQLTTFIGRAPISVAMLDRGMNYLAASARWVATFGRGRVDLVGLNHYDVIPDAPQAWRDINAQALEGAFLHNDEDPWIDRDGNRRWLSWAAQPWTDESGAIGGIVISSEDITARMEVTLALRDSNERFATIFHTCPVGITIGRLADGTILDLNPALEAIIEYRRDEALGRNGADLNLWVDPRVRAQVQRGLLERGEVRDIEGQFRSKSGRIIDIAYSARRVELAGRPHFISLVADITLQKEARRPAPRARPCSSAACAALPSAA